MKLLINQSIEFVVAVCAFITIYRAISRLRARIAAKISSARVFSDLSKRAELRNVGLVFCTFFLTVYFPSCRNPFVLLVSRSLSLAKNPRGCLQDLCKFDSYGKLFPSAIFISLISFSSSFFFSVFLINFNYFLRNKIDHFVVNGIRFYFAKCIIRKIRCVDYIVKICRIIERFTPIRLAIVIENAK